MSGETPFEVGKCYLVRCVTLYQVGRLESITDGWMVLSDASWVADTGRFSAALSGGKLGETESFGGHCIISVGAIVDAVEWRHDLP